MNGNNGGFGQGQGAYGGSHAGYSSFPQANMSGAQYGGFQQPGPPPQQQGYGGGGYGGR